MATNTNGSIEYFSLPSNIYEAMEMNTAFLDGKLTHESAIRMVRNSLRAQRACNEAIIFAYGLSGAGKSSTLNHLFGFEKEKIFIENAYETDTTFVTEYTATMTSEEWGVRNLEIGFIDVPGWNDTNGEYNDAKNLANIEHFIINHPYLGCRAYRCYPSILLIAIDATQKRMAGQGADISIMMRSLSKLNIVDNSRPNVLFVLTNVMSIPAGEYEETLATIESILRNSSKQFLEVEEVKIAHIENHWEAHKLAKSGRSTILRDGSLQPDNVFKAMMELTMTCNDSVGQEGIKLYFDSRGKISDLICKRKSNPEHLSEDQIRKWEDYLACKHIRDNEVNQALSIYAKNNLEMRFGNPFVLNKLMSELHKNKLTKLNTLANLTLNQIKETMSPFILNEIESEALINVCEVKPFDLSHIIDTIGYGLKADYKERTNSSILKLKTEFHVMAQLRLPKCMEAGATIEKIRVGCERLVDLVLEGSDQIAPLSREIPIKYKFQIIYSIYTIKLILSDHQLLLSQLSPGFKKAVTALPESGIVEGNQVKREYVDFFNTYGHWVIVGCECGGFVEGEFEVEEGEDLHPKEHIRTYIHSLVDRLESEEVPDPDNSAVENIPYDCTNVFHRIDNCKLSWNGGKEMENNWTLRRLRNVDWISWVNSLSEKAILVSSHQIGNEIVVPVSEMVASFSNEKAAKIRLAHEKLDKAFGQIFENSRDYVRSISDDNTRRCIKQATNGFPNTATLIKMENSNTSSITPVSIDTIQCGDSILCKRGLQARYLKIKKVNTDHFDYAFLNIEHEQGDIKIAYNQPILILKGAQGSFNYASSIKKGNTIVFYNLHQRTFNKVQVTNISKVTCNVKYSIEIEDNSDFFVDQILVGDDNACFPGNASVVLKGGERVRMDELKIGDYVLSIHPTTGKPVYSRVYLWAHRDPHITATFLHITHPHGHLHISANHLILSGDKRRPVPADQLQVGDSIHFLSPCLSQQQEEERRDSQTLISVPVLHIQTCTQVGYYAPFTNNELIVVDGIAASVYSHISTHSQSDSSRSRSWLWSGVCHSVTSGLVHQFGMHRVGQCVLTPVRVGCKLGVGSVLSQLMDTNTHIHKYCQWLLNVYKNI